MLLDPHGHPIPPADQNDLRSPEGFLPEMYADLLAELRDQFIAEQAQRRVRALRESVATG